MKISLIALIRNEQDILNAFLNHIDGLFDEVFLLDHRSIDHSSEILKKAADQRNGFRYIQVEMNGDYQKEISTLLIHHLFKDGADFVFFLDCDEFFLIKDRNELGQKIKTLQDNTSIGSVRWINCFPDKLSESQLNYHTKIWVSADDSSFSKVIIPRSVYEKFNGELSLSQGNHLVMQSDGNPLASFEIGHLLHIPVRSKEQLISKAIRSSLSNQSRSTKKPGESYQYNEMLKLIRSSNLSDEEIRGCVNLYQKEGKIIPITKEELRSDDWRKTSLYRLKVARTKRFSYRIPRYDYKQINNQVISDHILSLDDEDPGRITFLEPESIIKLL
ncbi:MAG: glycosyltransferase family 2 protein [Anaerolineaceae bacterium]|nr:glycosyltransferase family 2 protein [Anaerolineaceae bacterium]